MKRTHLIAVLVGIVVIGIFAANASAMYNPGIGGFMQRDPGVGDTMAAPRVGAASPSQAGRFVPRDQYRDGMNLYQYVRSNPVRFADPSGRYGVDIHFYLTYYLSRKCGFDQFDSGIKDNGASFSEAYILSWADQYTDVNSHTEPWHHAGRFHFVTSPVPWARDKTFENSPEVNAIIDMAIGNNDLLQTGAGLHAYQDSWSHAGYGSGIGHVYDGHKPDWPFDRPDTAMRMARFSYWKMEALMKKRHCKPCSAKFDDFKDELLNIITSANSKDESKRVEVWKTSVLGVIYDDAGDSDAWAKDFVNAANTVRPE